VFTGIVEELGSVDAIERLPQQAARLRLRGPLVTAGAAHGESIAVNGVCLTVVDSGEDCFTADVMAETLRRSSLGDLQPGDPVNLERAMRADGRFGGHLVQGHVDGTAVVQARTPATHWELVRFSLPADLARYVVSKGSISVDGVSLTVASVGPDWFEVSLIPTTLSATTLGERGVGSQVNLEVDVLAKYVERMLDRQDDAS
jgi:riboflavin synthase